MSTFDILAALVLLFLALSIIVLAVVLGGLPGRIAHGRQHPHAQAVAVAGWIGLIFIPLWPLALVWAYLDAPRAARPSEVADADDLRRRLTAVEAALHMREAAE